MDKISFDIKKQESDQQFKESFEESLQVDKVGATDASETVTMYDSPLGRRLKGKFHECEQDRTLKEQEWLKDLRQYRGEYDPEILTSMHPKRSKAFMSLTRTKVKVVTSRMTDLLFPANKEKNWGINPTPVPDLTPSVLEAIQMQLQQYGMQDVTVDKLKEMINEEARKRCKAMEREMDDQLAEVKYRDQIRAVLRSGNLFGTGVLKGPFVNRKLVKRWIKSPEGWANIDIPKRMPWMEFVSIWDLYPDMNARRPEEMQHIFQRHSIGGFELQKLSDRDDFNGEAIRAYMRIYPDGDSEIKTFENDLRNMASGSEQISNATALQDESVSGYPRRTRKYDMLEFWGYLSVKELRDIDMDLPEDFEETVGQEVAVNAWVLGNMIVKINLSPVDGVSIPYYFYYYEKDETSIWGDGIPFIMRDPQSLLNASVRAMVDNAAISAGPIIEANEDLLSPDEDATDLYPFRVFHRGGRGADASVRAITVNTMPSYTAEFMKMTEFFLQLTDEMTSIPRYLAGESQMMSGAAARTATGLSMLMGAANITLKDQVKNFDDGITKPFIKALYNWNMDFNEKQEIKGDFSIIAKGSSSLIAREVRQEALNQMLAITANPIDMMYIKRDKLLAALFENFDLDDLDIIKDENEIAQTMQSMAQREEEDRQHQMKLDMIKAKSGGHMGPEEREGVRPSMERLPQNELQQGEIPEVS